MYKKILRNSLLTTLIILSGCTKDFPLNEIPIEEIFATITADKSEIAVEPKTNSKFKISLSKAIDKDITIKYTIDGNASNGIDYSEISETATIPANTLQITIPILVIDDSNPEEIETVKITLLTTSDDTVVLGSEKTALVYIHNEPEEFLLSPQEAKFHIVNPNASSATVSLFYNLKKIARTSFIVGQQDAFSSFYNDNIGLSDVKKTTGSDPGLLGSDFMFITDDKNNGATDNWFFKQESSIVEDVIEAYNKGIVNTFSWHLREPYEGLEFYTDKLTDFQKNNAFKSILPGGENHEYYKTKLDKIAKVTKSLVGSDGELIPIIFRPFHEFDGDWFWWGGAYCTPEQYISLWRFTVNYLKDDKGVNNMLFAFCPDKDFDSVAEYLSRYPGDDFVDILGMDNYGDFKDQGAMGLEEANSKLQIISSLAKDRIKIAALTESCYFVKQGETTKIPEFYSKNLYNALSENNVQIGYMMFWFNNKDEYCTPPPGESTTDDFLLFTNSPRSLLLNELPDLYAPINEL